MLSMPLFSFRAAQDNVLSVFQVLKPSFMDLSMELQMGKKNTAMFGILDGGEDHPYPPDRQFSCEASCKETWKWPTSRCERHTTFWAQD